MSTGTHPLALCDMRRVERDAAAIMACAVDRCIRTAEPLTVAIVKSEHDSAAAVLRHLCHRHTGSTSDAEPHIARVGVVLALLGFVVTE